MKNVLERAAENKSEEKIRYFKAKQAESYEFKVRYAEIRAWEFYKHPEIDGSCYVAVGGLDSITLLLFLRSIGINVPAVSVSVLEDRSIQDAHQQLGVIPLKPLKSKVEVIREFGWPVLSKEIADKIDNLQHPTPRNEPYRHSIMTGEKSDGTYSKRSMLPQKWMELFGGYEDELFRKPNFLVSDKCCYRDQDGTLRTTKAQRTGCSMCGFGIHMEKRPHRFDRLWERSPGEWEMWMNHADKLPDGTWYGWGHVLDYIGVEWREPWRQFEVQESLFDGEMNFEPEQRQEALRE